MGKASASGSSNWFFWLVLFERIRKMCPRGRIRGTGSSWTETKLCPRRGTVGLLERIRRPATGSSCTDTRRSRSTWSCYGPIRDWSVDVWLSTKSVFRPPQMADEASKFFNVTDAAYYRSTYESVNRFANDRTQLNDYNSSTISLLRKLTATNCSVLCFRW